MEQSNDRGPIASTASVVRTALAVHALGCMPASDVGLIISDFLATPSTSLFSRLAAQMVTVWVIDDASAEYAYPRGIKELVMAAAVRGEADAWNVVCWVLILTAYLSTQGAASDGELEPADRSLRDLLSELAFTPSPVKLDAESADATPASPSLTHVPELVHPHAREPLSPNLTAPAAREVAGRLSVFLVDALTAFFTRATRRKLAPQRAPTSTSEAHLPAMDGTRDAALGGPSVLRDTLLSTPPPLVALLLGVWPFAAEEYSAQFAAALARARSTGMHQHMGLSAWIRVGQPHVHAFVQHWQQSAEAASPRVRRSLADQAAQAARALRSQGTIGNDAHMHEVLTLIAAVC